SAPVTGAPTGIAETVCSGSQSNYLSAATAEVDPMQRVENQAPGIELHLTAEEAGLPLAEVAADVQLPESVWLTSSDTYNRRERRRSRWEVQGSRVVVLFVKPGRARLRPVVGAGCRTLCERWLAANGYERVAYAPTLTSCPATFKVGR